MKKLQILIIGVVLLFTVSVALAQNDATQNITQTGFYRITVRGADGGNATLDTITKGGSGATVAATFSLQAGDVLTLVTGITGGNNFGGGGGGGTAVILTRNGTQTLLIVAGAGGGAVNGLGGGGGSAAQGTAGGGGAGLGGGGGGFNANGANSVGGGGGAGTLAGGGAGGFAGSPNGGAGGYGFGGGGGSDIISGGGGGGYGGGNGGGNFGVGSGGSSFVEASGINVTRTDGTSGGGTNQNGLISIAPTTAASVSISGRVLTEAKRGLMNAVVYLTEADGTVHQARTSAFGYYRFADISAGQTVIITVISKRYQFTPQVISVNEEINELNFVSQP